jgi:hypothetical protein
MLLVLVYSGRVALHGTEIPTIIDHSATMNYPSATGSIIVVISVPFKLCVLCRSMRSMRSMRGGFIFRKVDYFGSTVAFLSTLFLLTVPFKWC